MDIYRDELGDFNTDRALHERSYLKFQYPRLANDSTSLDIVYLPFYENPMIKESKKANYALYRPVSRSSSLFTYTGAEARMVSLSFNMTVDHMVNYYMNWETFVLSFGETPDAQKAKFKRPASPPGSSAAGPNGQVGSHQDLATEYFTAVPPPERPAAGGAFASTLLAASLAREDREIAANSTQGRRANTINIMMFWINIIRSSLSNHSKNSVLGPPIIRLNHGILYRDVPFICMDYSIEEEPKAGMEMYTLMPRVLKVNMKLQEIRTGNFEGYKVSQPGNRDCVAGWEAVINGGDDEDYGHTMDPQPLGD